MDNMELNMLAYLNPSTKLAIIKAIVKDYAKQYHDSNCKVEKQQQEVCIETIHVLVTSLDGEIGFLDLLSRLS